MGINYKKNPPRDDFMADVLDLLGEGYDDDIFAENKANDGGDDEF